MASTCSTSLVPIPKAKAPNAPCVEVCESPHTTVRPGWVRPNCGPTTCTMPCSTSPSECSRTPNSVQLVAQRLDLGTRHRVGDRLVDVDRRDVVVLGRDREVGATHRSTSQPQALEGLRAGHLVDEVEVDEEEVRFTFCGADDVLVPNLLGQRAG